MTMTQNEVSAGLELFEVSPTKKMPAAILRKLLPDVETALFFAKTYKLPRQKLTALLQMLFQMDVVQALTAEGGLHSNELQSYLVETVPDVVQRPGVTLGDTGQVPDTEVLAAVWEAAQITVASSIEKVASELAGVLDALPSQYGTLVFQQLRKLNVQRNTLSASFEPTIQHKRTAKNLVILDVSGSMSERTIRRIVGEVVGLAYKSDSELAIVSNQCFHWGTGEATVESVLRAAEYQGTHYETLAPLLQYDYNVVTTIADYDSAYGAQEAIAQCTGRIGKVIDISLVNRPTFLAECVGQLANEVEPILVGNDPYGRIVGQY